MCLLGYVDQVFAQTHYISGLVYSTFKFVMLQYLLLNKHHCNNTNCVIVTKFVLL